MKYIDLLYYTIHAIILSRGKRKNRALIFLRFPFSYGSLKNEYLYALPPKKCEFKCPRRRTMTVDIRFYLSAATEVG